MKTKAIILSLAALALGGCESVAVKKRTMEIITPLVTYKSTTEGFTASDPAAPKPPAE
jgi:Tfp pilus assembly major pilin PilA